MAFVHPVLGALTVAFSVWILSRGLVARQGGRNATTARRFHRTWAKWALAAMVLSAATGISSTLLLRPDLELGETWHLAVGLSAVGVMSLGGLLTRAFTARPSLRSIHPWLGIAAVVLALAQAVLGIELLP